MVVSCERINESSGAVTNDATKLRGQFLIGVCRVLPNFQIHMEL
jgi:hypothetical protein